MKRVKFILLLMLLLPVLSSAEIYTWVDEQGKVHYSDQPPVSQQQSYEEKEVDAGSGEVDPEYQANQEQMQEQMQRWRDEDERDKEDQKRQQQNKQSHDAYCASLKAQVDALSVGISNRQNEVTITNEDGEQEVLDEDGLRRKKREYEQKYKQECLYYDMLNR